jgi:hypothetical protein
VRAGDRLVAEESADKPPGSPPEPRGREPRGDLKPKPAPSPRVSGRGRGRGRFRAAGREQEQDNGTR